MKKHILKLTLAVLLLLLPILTISCSKPEEQETTSKTITTTPSSTPIPAKYRGNWKNGDQTLKVEEFYFESFGIRNKTTLGVNSTCYFENTSMCAIRFNGGGTANFMFSENDPSTTADDRIDFYIYYSGQYHDQGTVYRQ